MTQISSASGTPDDASRASPSPPREAELVARVRLGDAEAFEHLFHAYYDPLCAFAFGYVKSASTAEDIVQETFVRIWERRSSWEIRGSPRQYLYGAIRNRALMHLRHARVVERARERALHAMPPGEPSANTADEAVRMRELAQALAHAVERLPARRRQVYTLRWQHGLTFAEIADVMQVSVKCVEAQMALASKAIREALADFF